MQPLIEECLRQLRAAVPVRVEILRALDAGCPAVMADAEQIRQVILDFCFSAARALPDDGGQIKVALENDPAAARARILIWDDGPALDAAAREKIFNPIFKKPAHRRGGLEFFVARDIVFAHEGEITVESEPHRGTTFCISLPARAGG